MHYYIIQTLVISGQSKVCHCILVVCCCWSELLLVTGDAAAAFPAAVTVKQGSKQFSRIVFKCQLTQFSGSGDDFP